jgi:acyl carrier protein
MKHWSQHAVGRLSQEHFTEVRQTNVTRDKRLWEELAILIDIAVATEDAFGIRIPDEELERFQTVGDAIDYVQRAMAA